MDRQTDKHTGMQVRSQPARLVLGGHIVKLTDELSFRQATVKSLGGQRHRQNRSLVDQQTPRQTNGF